MSRAVTLTPAPREEFKNFCTPDSMQSGRVRRTW